MVEKPSGESHGLLSSLSTLVATLVAIVHTRLDLLSNDLEEGREHLLSLLMVALATLFFLGVGVVLVIILLVAVFWDTHRFLVLGALAGFFLMAGVATWRFAVRKMRARPKIFAASLAELIKDRGQLDSRS
ncbi:MAG: phage holin family protein [Rugosibacter sp.]|jgi:uncharacterized membrane protein YqjE|nr:phage holin family protein [Rugosibacter sp.]MDO9272472.1 phage holin family protein [Rugosibacter sp.]